MMVMVAVRGEVTLLAVNEAVRTAVPLPPAVLSVSQSASSSTVQFTVLVIVKSVLPALLPTDWLVGSTVVWPCRPAIPPNTRRIARVVEDSDFIRSSRVADASN